MEDLKTLLERLKNEGFKIMTLGGFLGNFFAKKRRSSKAKSEKSESKE